MSCCDDMKVKVINRAEGDQGSGVSAEVAGVNDTGASTLTAFWRGKVIDYTQSVEGSASSGEGTEGKAYGTIEMQLPWQGANEILSLTYQGQPKNRLGWCPCTATYSVQDSAHYTAVVTAKPGENEECVVAFRIQNK